MSERKVKVRWTGPTRLVPDLGLTLTQGEMVEVPISFAHQFADDVKRLDLAKRPSSTKAKAKPKPKPAAPPAEPATEPEE